MKEVYPVVLSQGKDFYLVYIPDFDINTQGTSVADAIEMARDAIGMIGICKEDQKIALPKPSDLSAIKRTKEEIVTLVDIDFAAYRRKNDMRMVRKNLTIPSWLNVAAEEAGVNFSKVLQDALMEKVKSA